MMTNREKYINIILKILGIIFAVAMIKTASDGSSKSDVILAFTSSSWIMMLIMFLDHRT